MKLKHIVIVEDDVSNLKFLEKILKPYYKLNLLISGAQALRFLEKNIPDLILLDINMPDMDGYETLSRIKKDNKLDNIPVILISELDNINDDFRGFELGAVDVVSKHIPQLIINRVKLHLEITEYKNDLEEKVREKTELIEHLQDVMMLAIAELVECRDENTGGHIKHTANYMKILLDEIVKSGLYSDILTSDYVRDIIRSAPLHDVGKIGINDATLLKAGRLDDAEFEYMKNHAELGGQTIQRMINETNVESFLYIAKDMAHYHHEKWDGSGYPRGLKGGEIPISARIMAIVDVYDALTTKRPYKEALSHEKALEIILEGKGKSFDPKIIEIFEKIHHKFKSAKF
ncbi:response regulator [Terrisporobacter mayombei]|nr:response regulator [Terrisporobacter mayombei]